MSGPGGAVEHSKALRWRNIRNVTGVTEFGSVAALVGIGYETPAGPLLTHNGHMGRQFAGTRRQSLGPVRLNRALGNYHHAGGGQVAAT